MNQQDFMPPFRAYNEAQTEQVEGKGRHGTLTMKPFTPAQVVLVERLSYLSGLGEGVIQGKRDFIRGNTSLATYKRTIAGLTEHGFLEAELAHRGEGRGSSVRFWLDVPEAAHRALADKLLRQEKERAERAARQQHRNLPPSKRPRSAHSETSAVHPDVTSAHSNVTTAQNEPPSAQNETIYTAQSEAIISGSTFSGNLLVEDSLSHLGDADASGERDSPVDAEIVEEDGIEPDTSEAERLRQHWHEWAREDNMVLTGTPAQQLASVHKILETVSAVEAAEVIWRVFQKKDRPCYRRADPQWAAQDWARFTGFQAPPTKTEANIRMLQNLKDRAVAMDRADAAQSDAGSSQAAFDDKGRVEPAPRPATVVAEYRPEPKGPAIAPKHFEASDMARKWMDEYPALKKAVRIRLTLTDRIKTEGWTDVEQALAAYVPQAAAS